MKIYIMDQGGNVLRLDRNGNQVFFPLSYFSHTQLGISKYGELLLIAEPRFGNWGAYYYDAEGRYLKKVDEIGAETYALCLPTSVSQTSKGVTYQIKNSPFISKVAAVWEEDNVKKEKTITWAFPKNTSYAVAILCQVILLIVIQRTNGKVQRRKCNKA